MAMVAWGRSTPARAACARAREEPHFKAPRRPWQHWHHHCLPHVGEQLGRFFVASLGAALFTRRRREGASRIAFAGSGGDGGTGRRIQAQPPGKEVTDSASAAAGSSSLQAFWNCSNCLVGTGVLGIPYAYAKLGILPGAATMLAIAAVSLYTALQLSSLASAGRQLLSRQGRLAPQTVVGYEELAEMARGAPGRRVAALLLYSLLVGVVGIFLVLLARSFASLGLVSVPTRLRIALAAALTVPLLAVRDLRGLARSSSFGLCALVACLLVAVAEAVRQPLPAGGSFGVPLGCASGEQLAALGVLILAYASHGQFPALQSEMGSPQQFPTVLAATFAVAMALNFFFPIIIVQRYGAGRTPEMVLEALSVGWRRTACVGCIAVNTWLRLPLPTFAAALPLERRGWHPFLARAVVLFLATALAIGVPGFVKLTGLVGLIAGAALAFVLPPLLENVLRGPQGSLAEHGFFLGQTRRALNGGIALLGVFFGALGVLAGLR